MKNLILTFTLLMTFGAQICYAGDLTGVGARALLLRNNINPNQALAGGNKLLLGDLTGVGKRVKLEQIKFYLSNDKVITKEQIQKIITNSNRGINIRAMNPAILEDINFNELKMIKSQRIQLQKGEIKGLIIKK